MDLIRPWTKTTPRPRFHVSLSLADDVQRTEQVLDHAIYLSPVQAYEVGYPDAAVDRLKQGAAGAEATRCDHGDMATAAVPPLGVEGGAALALPRWRWPGRALPGEHVRRTGPQSRQPADPRHRA